MIDSFQFLTATTDPAQDGTGMMIMQFGLIAVMLLIMYFVLIRPQRKKQKEEAKMRNNIQVGDEIVTIGGIVGKIVAIKEDSLLIETGADRDKVRIMKWAIQQNNTVHD